METTSNFIFILISCNYFQLPVNFYNFNICILYANCKVIIIQNLWLVCWKILFWALFISVYFAIIFYSFTRFNICLYLYDSCVHVDILFYGLIIELVFICSFPSEKFINTLISRERYTGAMATMSKLYSWMAEPSTLKLR